MLKWRNYSSITKKQYIYHRFIVSFPMGLHFLINNIPSSGVLMKRIGAEFLQPDALPGANHMGRMQYEIVLNIAFCPKLN